MNIKEQLDELIHLSLELDNKTTRLFLDLKTSLTDNGNSHATIENCIAFLKIVTLLNPVVADVMEVYLALGAVAGQKDLNLYQKLIDAKPKNGKIECSCSKCVEISKKKDLN